MLRGVDSALHPGLREPQMLISRLAALWTALAVTERSLRSPFLWVEDARRSRATARAARDGEREHEWWLAH
jgi:hypothetical protein